MFILKIILYGFADILFLLICYVVKYRKKIIDNNLRLAFPYYSDKERKKIMRKFYRHFTQLMAEIIIISLSSKKGIEKMIKKDFSIFQDSINQNKNIILLSGHIINWELMGIAMSLTPFYKTNLGFYLPIQNKILNKYMLYLRSKFGAILINVYKFAREIIRYKNRNLTLGFLADQRPFVPQKSYWVDFFKIKTPFVKEPEKCAILFNADVYFFSLVHKGIGRYEAVGEKILFDKNKEGDLTQQFAHKLEQAIIANPELYLWSHNRWKFKYDNVMANKKQ